MTRDDIQRTMDKVPGLNDFGIGVYNQRKLKLAERERKLAEGRRDLLKSVDACNKVCEWLGQIDKIKTINERQTSYGLKHIAENDIGYITNGVFITAAVHCGYPYRIERDCASVWVGMSERSIKLVTRRQAGERKQN